MAEYILAVDGGQTHSAAIVADRYGLVLGSGSGGPANHYLEPGGRERFIRSMSDCIYNAFKSANIPLQPVLASHYCLTGVHAEMAEVLQRVAPSQKQSVAGDREASLTGATLDRPAVLVLAGTGSIAYGVDKHGREVVSGGWGYIMGDEGSAAWIARQALSAATSATDGRGMPTNLTHLIPEHYHVADLRALHELIYTHQVDRVSLASISSVVGNAAWNGDKVAQAILSAAAGFLGDAAIAVLNQLGAGTLHIPITSAGGVFKSGPALVQSMMERIQTVHPKAFYIAPRYPPIIGALFLALQSIHISIDQRLQDNVSATASIWESTK